MRERLRPLMLVRPISGGASRPESFPTIERSSRVVPYDREERERDGGVDGFVPLPYASET